MAKLDIMFTFHLAVLPDMFKNSGHALSKTVLLLPCCQYIFLIK